MENLESHSHHSNLFVSSSLIKSGAYTQNLEQAKITDVGQIQIHERISILGTGIRKQNLYRVFISSGKSVKIAIVIFEPA